MTTPELTAITIRQITPELAGDYLAFFDDDAFADNPRWGFCYCNFLYADHEAKAWGERTAGENRAAVREHIGACRMRGYLAYIGGRPVGWCNAAPRTLIPLLMKEPDPDAVLTGSIACFVVAKPHRGQGIARELLRAACDGFRAQGLSIAEAYPRKEAASQAENHFGPLSLYLSEDFEITREDDDGGLVVRKDISRADRRARDTSPISFGG